VLDPPRRIDHVKRLLAALDPLLHEGPQDAVLLFEGVEEGTQVALLA
jgi:hypothetical protein